MEWIKELYEHVYFGNTVSQYLVFFGCIILGIVLGKIFYYISKGWLRKISSRSSMKFDDYLIDIIEVPIVLLLITLGLSIGTHFLTLDETAGQVFDNIIFVLIAMTATWFILRLIDMLIRVYLEPRVSESENKLDDQILPIVRKSLKTIILILASIVVLSNLGYDVLSILAGLGIGGLAFALAAQDTVKNVFGGITIFWDKPFHIGDFVDVEGRQGTIAEVGLRTTRIKTVGGTTIVIPNSHVANSLVENLSTRTARRIVQTIGLTYDTSTGKMEEAISLIRELITAISGIDGKLTETRFINFGAYSLDMEIVYWINDVENWKMIIHEVNMGIKKRLDESGIEMAFPTATHYVINQKQTS